MSKSASNNITEMESFVTTVTNMEMETKTNKQTMPKINRKQCIWQQIYF